MNKNQKFKLIDGKYDPQETFNILFSLINSKINYHHLEVFKAKETKGKDSSHSIKRIKELKDVNENLKLMIDYATENKLKVKVSSVIQLSLVKK